jgi:hypothetical protein
VTAPDILPHLDAVQAALVGADLVVGLGGAPTPVPASQMYVALYSDPGQSVSEVAWRPEELGGPPLQRDDSVTPPLYFLPVQYRLRSTT